MTQIIDFRNAKFHGQTRNDLPHGLGIMIDYKNVFCLAQWYNGNIQGKCLVVFGDSKIFYGQIVDKNCINICTYHLKDRCQMFCNFQKLSDKHEKQKNTQQAMARNYRLVALLPTFKMIISVEGQDEQQLQIVGEEVYKQGDFHSLKGILQKMLNWRFQAGQLQQLLSVEDFIRVNFTGNPEYSNLLDILQTVTPQGDKQLFIAVKSTLNFPFLGIKIQNCMSNPNDRHNDSNSYIVKALGFFTKQGSLQYGLKNVKTLIKASVKQQAIYSDEKTITRYEDQLRRPKKCSINVLNHLKKSLNFRDEYLPIKYLSLLQVQCLNINFNIKQSQTKKHAQLVLQNPKQLSLQQKQHMEVGRLMKINRGTIHKNQKDQNTSPYNRNNQAYGKKNQQLQKTRQDIYRSVSKKKINGTGSSPHVQGASTQHNVPKPINTPQKGIKPSQLTNVKPILEIYRNTEHKSFYNSINKNGNLGLQDKTNKQGYKFALGKKDHTEHQETTKNAMNDPNKTIAVGSLHDNDYFKQLQDRKRLYQGQDPSKNANREPNFTQYDDQGQKFTGTRKKFSYLPQQNHTYSRHSNQRNQTSYSRYDQPSSNYQQERSAYNKNGRVQPQPNIYDPHYHFHDHFDAKNTAGQNHFHSQQRTSPDRTRSPQKSDQQSGKLGRRVIKKPRDYDYPKEQPPKLQTNVNKNTHLQNDPIIVPEFKINNANVANSAGYRKRLYEEKPQPIPKRQHHLNSKNQNEFGDYQSKTPLKSQKYRKQYLQQSSPIRKTAANRNTPEVYKNEYEVIMNPTFNFVKEDFGDKYKVNRQNKYSHEQQDSLYRNQNIKSKSPLQKKRKILNVNPFDS